MSPALSAYRTQNTNSVTRVGSSAIEFVNRASRNTAVRDNSRDKSRSRRCRKRYRCNASVSSPTRFQNIARNVKTHRSDLNQLFHGADCSPAPRNSLSKGSFFLIVLGEERRGFNAFGDTANSIANFRSFPSSRVVAELTLGLREFCVWILW